MPKPNAILRVVSLLVMVTATPSLLQAADSNYFPDDTEAVVVVNLKQLRNAEAIRSQPDACGELDEVLGRFAGLHAVQKYLAVAGLNVFHDARTVTFVYTLGRGSEPSFVVLDGDFDAGKSSNATTGSMLKIVKSGGHTAYEVAPRGEVRLFAAQAGPSTLIAAPTAEAIADALARGAGTKKSALKKELRASLEAVSDRQSIAFVATGSNLARFVGGAGLPNTENAVVLLKSVTTVAGGVTLEKDIQFQLAVDTESEETATKLAESANGAVRVLLTLTRQTADRDGRYSPVVDVVKALRFSSEGAGIRFRGGVTLDTVEKLLTTFPVAQSTKDGKSPGP